MDEEPARVVCVPPGAQLLVFGISQSLQEQFSLRDREEVTFTQISPLEREHRDALCFTNGAILRLGLLPEGQRLRVMRLSSREDIGSLRMGALPEGTLQGELGGFRVRR